MGAFQNALSKKKWCLLILSSQRFEHLETYSVRLLHLYFTSYDLKTFLLS